MGNTFDQIVKNIAVVSIREDDEFAQKLIEHLGQTGTTSDFLNPRLFTNEEACPVFVPNSITGKKVYIVASPSYKFSPMEWWGRIMLVSDAARIEGAAERILVAPDLLFSRQDRSPASDEKLRGQPFSARLVAETLKIAGIDKILTMDLHSERIREIYEDPKNGVYGHPGVIYNLNPAPIITHYLLNQSSLVIEDNGKNIVFVAPDKGAKDFMEFVRLCSGLANSSYIACKKTRKEANDPDKVNIEIIEKSQNFNGFDGKSLIWLDDIGDTCGTIAASYRELTKKSEYGKAKDMYIYLTHPVFAGRNFRKPMKLLQELNAKEIIVTNSHPFIEHRRTDGFKRNSTVLRCAAYFASVIVNCVEDNRLYEDVFYASTPADLAKFSELYDIKRSTLHFTVRGQIIKPVRRL